VVIRKVPVEKLAAKIIHFWAWEMPESVGRKDEEIKT